LVRGLKRVLASDFLSPMKSRIGFGSADIEAIKVDDVPPLIAVAALIRHFPSGAEQPPSESVPNKRSRQKFLS
jgi:hypothetical protein